MDPRRATGSNIRPLFDTTPSPNSQLRIVTARNELPQLYPVLRIVRVNFVNEKREKNRKRKKEDRKRKEIEKNVLSLGRIGDGVVDVGTMIQATEQAETGTESQKSGSTRSARAEKRGSVKASLVAA